MLAKIIDTKDLKSLESVNKSYLLRPYVHNDAKQPTPLQHACMVQWYDGIDYMLFHNKNNKISLNVTDSLYDIVLSTFTNEKSKVHFIDMMCRNNCKISENKLNKILYRGIITEFFEVTKKILGRRSVFNSLIENMDKIQSL